MLALGVTGDVGAGKSTVSRIWAEMGASVLDADEIVRSLWKRADIIEAASSRWGKDILGEDGVIVPRKIAAKAFSDPEEYRWMCGLLHPPVRVEMERTAASLEGWVVAEIPLLFEGGVPWWIDATAYVTADSALRASRNAARGMDSAELERRETFLLPGEEKKAGLPLFLIIREPWRNWPGKPAKRDAFSGGCPDWRSFQCSSVRGTRPRDARDSSRRKGWEPGLNAGKLWRELKGKRHGVLLSSPWNTSSSGLFPTHQ